MSARIPQPLGGIAIGDIVISEKTRRRYLVVGFSKHEGQNLPAGRYIRLNGSVGHERTLTMPIKVTGEVAS